jgi:hypothetical protein
MKMQAITSQMMNSEKTRLFPKILMIGQLKKRAPGMNKNIQTSLLMGTLVFRVLPAAGKLNPPSQPALVSRYLSTIYTQIPYEKTRTYRCLPSSNCRE